MSRLTALFATILCSFPGSAAEPTSLSPAPRGKLILDNELDRPPSADWRTGKGTWTVQDGSWKAVEIAAEKHAASARRKISLHDGVIQCEVRLDGARFAILKLNGTGGHCCQVVLSADGVRLQRYTTENEVKKWTDLESSAAPVAPGKWHTVVLELRGQEVRASIDGTTLLRGQNATLDVDKNTLVLNVAGDSASFRNLQVREASSGGTHD